MALRMCVCGVVDLCMMTDFETFNDLTVVTLQCYTLFPPVYHGMKLVGK